MEVNFIGFLHLKSQFNSEHLRIEFRCTFKGELATITCPKWNNKHRAENCWKKNTKRNKPNKLTKLTSLWVVQAGACANSCSGRERAARRAKARQAEYVPLPVGCTLSVSLSLSLSLWLTLSRQLKLNPHSGSCCYWWPTTKSDGPSVWPATKVSFSRWNSLVRRGHKQIKLRRLCARGLFTLLCACVCVRVCYTINGKRCTVKGRLLPTKVANKKQIGQSKMSCMSNASNTNRLIEPS